jgi:16S rRNA (guanine527-N7)-methyltransferase
VKREPGAVTERLEELALQWSLPASATTKLGRLLEIVETDRRASTGVRVPRAAVDVHVADSLAALPWIDASGRSADIGSGAGFPGLVIAIARPEIEVELVESAHRKCEFMTEAADALDVGNVRVVNARVEEWGAAAGRARYDRALARAVAPLATLVEYAAPLLARRGMLIAWKGARDPVEEAAGARAAAQLGMAPRAVEQVRPYAGSRDHNLHLFEKTGPTPAGFPRRTGAARKRPVG